MCALFGIPHEHTCLSDGAISLWRETLNVWLVAQFTFMGQLTLSSFFLSLISFSFPKRVIQNHKVADIFHFWIHLKITSSIVKNLIKRAKVCGDTHTKDMCWDLMESHKAPTKCLNSANIASSLPTVSSFFL